MAKENLLKISKVRSFFIQFLCYLLNTCCPSVAAKNKIEGYRRWFIEDKIYRTKEENRMGTPRTTADLFGVEGSFRKLIID